MSKLPFSELKAAMALATGARAYANYANPVGMPSYANFMVKPEDAEAGRAVLRAYGIGWAEQEGMVSRDIYLIIKLHNSIDMDK